MTLRIEPHEQGVVIAVKVVPNSSRDQIVGPLGDALKIKVAAPPEAGRANKAVEALLARTLQIPPSRVSVIAGHTQPQKRVLLAGLNAAGAAALL